MKRLVMLCLICLFPSTALAAKNAALPAPAGFKVVAWRGHASNLHTDFLFGFNADTGAPIFHTKTQESLHRQHGWVEALGLGDFTGPDGVLILILANTYKSGGASGSHWARAAAQDFRVATSALGFTHLQSDPLVAAPADGTGYGTILQTADQQGQLNVGGALWSGNTEVEGLLEGADYTVEGQPDPSTYQATFTALLQQALTEQLAHQTAHTIGPCQSSGCSG